VVKNYFKFRRLFQKLLKLAMERQPDVIICVDFSGFNRRLVHAVKQHIRTNRSAFNNWNPRLVQFVSPQVWASRPNRVYQVARDYDVVLSIFPFEKDWYARRVPKFRVEFVGHPMLNRFQPAEGGTRHAGLSAERILLLPGSRVSELRRHLGAMLGALKLIQAKRPACRAKMVLPDESLMRLAKSLGVPDSVEIQIGNLSQALRQADVAIASTGTVTMECAFFGVPTVTLYKLSWATYQVGRRIMTVKWFTMPNILANEEIYPEFLQSAATPENLASAALELLQNESRRAEIKTQLAQVVASLGGPGASERAAAAILGLLQPRT
jgi:lipid-A-disaccharide synthase